MSRGSTLQDGDYALHSLLRLALKRESAGDRWKDEVVPPTLFDTQ
jgi:hypothetical protein